MENKMVVVIVMLKSNQGGEKTSTNFLDLFAAQVLKLNQDLLNNVTSRNI